MRGAAYDAVFLEETNGDDLAATTDHLDLATWPEQIARLRACGAITETTQLVAIHLGHRNPPPPQLRDRMQAWRAHIPADGEIFTLGEPPAPRRVLVLGGARSGKSHWAESLLANCNDVGYVATAWPRPDDLEWQTRIEEHLRRRPATWSTYETFDVGAVIGKHNAVLVDCATLWLAGQLEKHDDIDALVAAVAEANGTVVVVSNEVGSGVVPATESGRQFRDKLGTLNAQLASACDEVWLVTAGLPRRLK
jgi:adenosylcobinamide kinase/adenosylcobinamide-phosphate guanylyltransferase